MGLCARLGWGLGGVGVVGVLEFRFSTCSLAVWGVGLLGFGEGECVLWGVCFRFGKKLFGAAYHLHDECHIFNILG